MPPASTAAPRPYIDSENPDLLSTFVGEWKDGKEWEGTLSTDDGTVLATYSEGVETKKN